MIFKKAFCIALLSCSTLTACHDSHDHSAEASAQTTSTFATPDTPVTSGDPQPGPIVDDSLNVYHPDTVPGATDPNVTPTPVKDVDEDLADYVNTLRGTHSNAYISDGYSRGMTFPATAVPFGFNMWTPVNRSQPDNASSHGWSPAKAYDGDLANDFFYQFYEDAADSKPLNTIQAFAVVHEPSTWVGNRQTLQIMPVSKLDASGNPLTAKQARAEIYQHKNEVAHAHYYSVTFDNGTKTEITPTDHAAYIRFTAPADLQVLNTVLDTFKGIGGTLAIDASTGTISGSTTHGSPTMYFYGTFDAPVQTNGAASFPSWLRFDTSTNKVVGLKIATSFLSTDQAKANLDQEIGTKSFDDVMTDAKAAWNAKLNLVQVDGATEDQKKILYSNLYRSFLYPNSAWEDVAGTPKYMSPYTSPQSVQTGKTWTNNGFWDTYRTTWPLYALLLPEQDGEMIDGFLRGYVDGGWVSRWAGPGYNDMMVATSTDIIFADAYAKGIRNFNVDNAYASMLKNGSVYSAKTDRGRKGMDQTPYVGYSTIGDEEVSWSLEAYLNDFGISQMAKALGKTDDAAYFANSAISYANIFDGTSTGTWAGGWFRSKSSSGAWTGAPTPLDWYYGYTEGNAWSYALLAPQDGQGLANLYGGRDQLKTKLDTFFTTPTSLASGQISYVKPEIKEADYVSKLANVGQYQHSDQPVHHAIYMYNYAGAPANGQKYLRDVMDKLYDSGFDASGNSTGNGYAGDEDTGEMSAWYVFSAMGFYPVSVRRPEYAIGAPYFAKMTVRVTDATGNPQHIVVNAPDVSSGNRYVQSVKLNGQPITRSYLTHAELIAGATLDFVMGPNPSQWGTGINDVPTSITQGNAKPTPLKSLLPLGNYTVTASNAANTANLSDRNSSTTWSSTTGAASWIEADKKSTTSSDQVAFYTLTSPSGTGSDPTGWVLKGSNDGTNWVAIDTRDTQSFPWRQQLRPFALKSPVNYSKYRLEFSGTAAVGLGEVELYGTPDAVPAAASAPAAPSDAG